MPLGQLRRRAHSHPRGQRRRRKQRGGAAKPDLPRTGKELPPLSARQGMFCFAPERSESLGRDWDAQRSPAAGDPKRNRYCCVEAVHKASPIPRDEASTKAERLALPREAQITRALPLGFLHQLDQAAFFTDVLQDRSNFDSPAQLVLQDLFSEQCGKAPARTASY